ncbi:MAG: heme ABC transporter ATP-binding protein [Sphingomonadales bacterium]|nr:heme ABC transporter ATP-binding protein [Sphingomonadales bacterium]
MLEARDVTYSVNGATLVANVHLAVPPGRVVALIGPNGAGKSTLLRILAGEMQPTRGTALLDGRELARFSAAELARHRAVVPQASALTFPFTVLEVAMLGVSVPGFETTSLHAKRAALDTLDAVGLRDLAGRLYVQLSGGERQRVHIARALSQLATAGRGLGHTRCLLLDEPTSSLDLAHQSLVLAAVRRQASLGTAIVVVFHDLNLAAALADELVLLEGGRVMAAGRAGEVLRDDLLSAAYGCEVSTNRTPGDGKPFILPPAVFQELLRQVRSGPDHRRQRVAVA